MRGRWAFPATAAAAVLAMTAWLAFGGPGTPVRWPWSPQKVPEAALASTPLDSLIASGEPLYWDGEYEQARTLWQTALERATMEENDVARARALTWLGLVAFRLGDYEESQALGQEALDFKLRLNLVEDLPKSYNALGLIALSQGRLGEAALLFRKTIEAARAVDDHEALAKAANNLGLVQADLGEFTLARAGFQESVTSARALEDPLIEGRALSNLGMLEARLGDPLAAIGLFEVARQRYRESGDVTGEQHTLGQQGVAYAALGEPRRAIAVLDSALSLARKHGLRLEEASDLELIGEFHRDAGDYQGALEYYRKAGEINAELGLTIEAGVDLRRAAESYASLGDMEQARHLAERALAVHRTAEAHVETLDDLLVLTEIESRFAPPPRVPSWLDEARDLAIRLDSRPARLGVLLTEVRIADQAGESRRVLSLLDAADENLADLDYEALGEIQALRARAWARLGRLDKAAEAGRYAVAALERARERYGSGYLRTRFVSERRAVYAQLVEILVELGAVEEALEVADAARGRALLDHLGAARDGAPTRAAEPLPAEGEELLREIDGVMELVNDLEAIPPDERDSVHEETLGRLAARLGTLRGEYEAFLVRLEERAPRPAAILGNRSVGAGEIRAALVPGEVLIEYFVGTDRLLIFTVSVKEIRAIDVAVTESSLARQIRLVRELTGRPLGGRGDPSAVLESLHERLLRPVLDTGSLAAAKRLLVVPHGVLDHVPFAALRNPGTSRYLAEDFLLTSLPSAASLPAIRAVGLNVETEGRATVFVPFANFLPGTRAEGVAVRRELRDADLLEGKEANEFAVRRALASTGIVHIASHGVLNVRNPLFSRIEMQPGRSGRNGEDGRLEVHELLDIPIRSPLVFLSGCETASGEAWSSAFAAGEDYATLARVMLYSGARSVVATLWAIDDRGAAVFAARFYGHLRSRSSAEALALAQRDMIRSGRYEDPYYWAGYRLSGPGEEATILSRL